MLYTPMCCGPAMPFGSHEGNAMCAVLLQALRDHPAAFGEVALRARLACISGDGALVEGGPDHRHSSCAAAEKLWHAVFPEAGDAPTCTLWDPFHRTDVASWRAIRSSPAFNLRKHAEPFPKNTVCREAQHTLQLLHETLPGKRRNTTFLMRRSRTQKNRLNMLLFFLFGVASWITRRPQNAGDLRRT